MPELNEAVLRLIFKRSTNGCRGLRSLTNRKSFSAVCSSWRSVTSTNPYKLPWLMLSKLHSDQQTRSFLSLDDGEVHQVKFSGDASSSWCCGSSEGWLVMSHRTSGNFLYNPVTRDRINLPRHNAPEKAILDGNLVRPELSLYLSKAIVVPASSSSPSSLLVAAIFAQNNLLGFCRPGDDAWQVLDSNPRYPFGRRMKDVLVYSYSNAAVAAAAYHANFNNNDVDIVTRAAVVSIAACAAVAATEASVKYAVSAFFASLRRSFSRGAVDDSADKGHKAKIAFIVALVAYTFTGVSIIPVVENHINNISDAGVATATLVAVYKAVGASVANSNAVAAAFSAVAVAVAASVAADSNNNNIPDDTAAENQENVRFADIIHYRGELYAVTLCAKLGVIQFDTTIGVLGPRIQWLNMLPLELTEMKYCDWNYLVESIEGDLLMVVRRRRRHRQLRKDKFLETTKFSVFKLDESSDPMKWVRIESLGDQILFLGSNHSKSIPASDIPSGSSTLRGNCIYFTRDYSWHYLWLKQSRWLEPGIPYTCNDVGVFYLDDKEGTIDNSLSRRFLSTLEYPAIFITPNIYPSTFRHTHPADHPSKHWRYAITILRSIIILGTGLMVLKPKFQSSILGTRLKVLKQPSVHRSSVSSSLYRDHGSAIG